jgi:hypothetical protein
MPGMGELVPCTDGRWMIRPPQYCPHGHRFRPGLAAAAVAMAATLDDPQHVASQPAAARQLVAILATLSKRTQRRGKLAVVKSMTTSSPSA